MFASVRRGLGHRAEANFFASLTKGTLETFASNSLGSRSGKVIFFWTQDRQYMIKSLSDTEMVRVKTMMASYCDHLMGHPGSLLTRFCALYTVAAQDRKHTNYLVMKNTLDPDWPCDAIFDLKGSTKGRRTLAGTGPVQIGDRALVGVVMKDLDFIRSSFRLGLSPMSRDALLESIADDVAFLVSHKIMDYSLLLGVQKAKKQHVPRAIRAFSHIFGALSRKISHQHESCPKQAVYFLGIIDFLQDYSLRKWFETLWRSVFNDPSSISCVDPARYGKRFFTFASDLLC